MSSGQQLLGVCSRAAHTTAQNGNRCTPIGAWAKTVAAVHSFSCCSSSLQDCQVGSGGLWIGVSLLLLARPDGALFAAWLPLLCCTPGEDPHTGIVASVSSGNPALVTCVDDERLEFQVCGRRQQRRRRWRRQQQQQRLQQQAVRAAPTVDAGTSSSSCCWPSSCPVISH